MSPKSILAALLCVPWLSSYSQIPTTDQNWNSTLVFSDDFNSFNTSNWIKSFGWGNYPPGDPCIYLPSQVTASGGILTLKAESHTDPAYPLVNYKTGIITSIPTFKYGYFEIRCKLNSYGAKYMPAFWVWGADNCSCSGGNTCSGGWYDEIDFFEVVDGDFSVTSNFHSKDGSCTEWSSYEDSFSDATLPTSFHVFGYEWTPNRVICYMDGVPYRTVVDSRIADHLLKLVVQLGMPAHGGPSVTLPGYMETDYVKVYGLKMNCSTDEVITNYNSGTYTNYSVKKTITVNGTSNVYSTDKVTLRATDGIVINGDFTVQSGAQLVLLPTTCY